MTTCRLGAGARRDGARWPLACAVAITVAMAVLFVVASPGATQAPALDVNGGGSMTATTPNQRTTPEGRTIAEPGQNEQNVDQCAYFTNAEGNSDPGYTGTYSVIDRGNNVRTYGPGPLTLRVRWSGVYEGPDGTYAPPELRPDGKVECQKETAGEKYPLTFATLSGQFQGDSVSCTYDTTGASKFWRDGSGFHFELHGSCSIVDEGVTYVLTTHEIREGPVTSFFFDFSGGSPGVVRTSWLERYRATTVCTSKTCDLPPKPDTTQDTTPDTTETTSAGTTTTTQVGQTTTTIEVEGTATTTTTRPSIRPAGAPPPRRGTLLAGPVQPPSSPGTPTGGLPSGLAQAPPAPVAGSAPSAATAAGGAPVGSSALVPGAAAAPGTAGAAARVAAPLPLIAAVPGADAAAQYNMVRHERPAIPAPVLVVGGGLWLMFVCAAGVRILTPRPEPEPVPAPAVGFPVDIEEESP